MLPIYPRNNRKTNEMRKNGGASDFYRVHSRVTQFTPCVRGLPAQRRTSSLFILLALLVLFVLRMMRLRLRLLCAMSS